MIRNDNKGEKVMNYVDLTSVGSTLTKDLMVFPIDCSEAPETASEAEEMMGVHIYDLDTEWFTSLSEDDLNSFFYFIEITLEADLVSSVYMDWKTKLWGLWEETNNCYMNLEAI
tara:strand:- start:91 stop:432 length:342 start_codon:yes stop_codon:yes gene_type:complete